MWFSRLAARAIILFARLLTGMQARWNGCLPPYLRGLTR
jgi:hypothetical protein